MEINPLTLNYTAATPILCIPYSGSQTACLFQLMIVRQLGEHLYEFGLSNNSPNPDATMLEKEPCGITWGVQSTSDGRAHHCSAQIDLEFIPENV